MTHVEKHKLKSRLTILAFGVFGLFIAWMSDASARESFFVGDGCTAAGCHDGVAPTTTPTCNGCHAHGTHSNSAKDNLNFTAITDASTYNVGDTITIDIDGGYKSDWVRVTVYDGSGNVVAQSKGTCDNTTSSGSACSNGASMPISLTTTANATGTQMWTAAWYGNNSDIGSSSGGVNGTQSMSVAEQGWLPDATNANHGEEIVTIAAFTVNDSGTGGGTTPAPAPDPTTATTSSGGGSLSWPLIVLILIAISAMLIRDRRIEQELVKIKNND